MKQVVKCTTKWGEVDETCHAATLSGCLLHVVHWQGAAMRAAYLPNTVYLGVQMGLAVVGDEELGAIAVCTAVGHGHCPSPGVLHRTATDRFTLLSWH